MTERGVGLGSRRGPAMGRSMGTGRGWRGEEGTKSGGNDVGQKGREGRETGEEGRDGQQVIHSACSVCLYWLVAQCAAKR